MFSPLFSVKTKKLKTTFLIAIFSPVVISLGIAVLFFLQMKTIAEETKWQNHSDQVLTQANIVYRLIIDSQNGVRGYVVSSDIKYLQPYTKALEKYPAEFVKLSEMVSDNFSQTTNLGELKPLVNAWFQVAKDSVQSKKLGIDIYKTVKKGTGKLLMDEIRDKFDDFIKVENDVRTERSAKVKQITNITITLGLALSLALGFILSVLVRKALIFITTTYESAIADVETKASELYESREWFATTLTSIGDAVIVVDNKSRVAFLNPIAESLTGWKVQDAMNKPMSEVFHIINQDTRKPAFNPVDRVIKEGIIVGLANHTVLIGKHGKEVPIEDSASPIRNKFGKVIGVVLVFRDVTESHSARAAIAERENRFRALANSAPVFIWTSKADKETDWLNKVWLDYTGRTMEQELGKGWIEGIHPEDMDRCLNVFDSFFDARQPFEIEYRLRRYDGKYRWIKDKGIPRYSPDGSFVGYIGSCVDIHDSYENKLRLESLTSDLEKALSSRDEFLSIASHELKTPLTSLKLRLDMTMKSINVPENIVPSLPKLKKDLTLCRDQSQKLASLIEELLDVSRIQSGKLVFNFEEVNISELLQDTMEFYADQFKAVGTEVKADIEKDILAYCDRFRIDQVFVNLISNTIKYGAGKPVRISLKTENKEIKFVVKDFGIGIDNKIQHLIFNRFERAYNTKVISGLGLGLYITKQIVTAHHGQIEVNSKIGEGSTFTVTLPLRQKS